MIDRHQIAQRAPESGRRESLVRALELVHDLGQRSPLIVEVGASRNTRDRAMLNDGWATRVFAWYCDQQGGNVITIDPAAKAERATRKIVGDLSRHVTFVREDAERAIRQIGVAPALIYMDGPNDPDFHLRVWSNLPNKAPLVLIDDIWHRDYRIKGEALVPRLLADGYELVHAEYREHGQALLRRSA